MRTKGVSTRILEMSPGEWVPGIRTAFLGITFDARAGIEVTLMDKDANLAARPKQKPPLAGIVTFLFVIVFFFLVLLLGVSMVHHRFFQGQRVHSNGSVGQ